jgi:hypothetical protein
MASSFTMIFLALYTKRLRVCIVVTCFKYFPQYFKVYQSIKYIVARGPVARQRPRDSEVTSVARQHILNKQQLNSSKEWCFVRGPCQWVVHGTSLEFSQSVCGEETRS